MNRTGQYGEWFGKFARKLPEGLNERIIWSDVVRYWCLLETSIFSLVQNKRQIVFCGHLELYAIELEGFLGLPSGVVIDRN